MKKLSYLLLLTILILNVSCSKDDGILEYSDNHKIKVTLNLSGNYEDYELSYYTMYISDKQFHYLENLKKGFYELESNYVKKSTIMAFDLAMGGSDNDTTENIELKIYLDDELFYEENISISDDESFSYARWIYSNGKIKRVPKL
ncbi:MAG TPA: hypothetical protein DDZ39_11955 [Flavobacteriaceae bacterium]|jgi:hypothetical protein|nr:hypothetical protein [Flavobacteriaceae bacterium]HBS12186.1 hypothetical protein [Flavobacteriaceae bacterium]